MINFAKLTTKPKPDIAIITEEAIDSIKSRFSPMVKAMAIETLTGVSVRVHHTSEVELARKLLESVDINVVVIDKGDIING